MEAPYGSKGNWKEELEKLLQKKEQHAVGESPLQY
jgi:hypothetical protein